MDTNKLLLPVTLHIVSRQGGVTQDILNQVLTQLWKGYALNNQQKIEQQIGLFFKSSDAEVKLNNFTNLFKLI